MKEELTEIAERLKKYTFRNSDKLLIPVQVIVKALEDAFKKGEEKVVKDIEEIKENLKYPNSATEGERILMKQIINIFGDKIKNGPSRD